MERGGRCRFRCDGLGRIGKAKFAKKIEMGNAQKYEYNQSMKFSEWQIRSDQIVG